MLALPVHTANRFDDPVLVKVTIQNTGDYDLSIGNDCALRPDLWFDVFTQGGTNPSFPGVAYDRVAGPLVLKAHHLELPGTSQTVRVDQAGLSDYLTQHPTIAVTLLYSVFLNPISQAAGVAPGPGGYRQQFASPMERQAAPINTPQAVQDVAAPAMKGTIAERIHALELLGSYVLYLRGQAAPAAKPAGDAAATPVGGMPTPGSNAPRPPGGNQPAAASLQPVINSFTAAIQFDLHDPSPIVGYWAQYQAGRLDTEANRLATAMVMAQGHDWEQRVLGLMLASTLPPERLKQVTALLATDPVDYVKSLADATAAMADLPVPKK